MTDHPQPAISTGQGDNGETGILAPGRVQKDDIRIDAYGTVDELNAHIGVTLALPDCPDELQPMLKKVSNWLFELGSDLATPKDQRPQNRIEERAIHAVEEYSLYFEARLPALKNFVLPGGTQSAAQLHVARTVCRRAERCVVTLNRQTGDARRALIFLNRLSDLFFLMARYANRVMDQPEIVWQPEK